MQIRSEQKWIVRGWFRIQNNEHYVMCGQLGTPTFLVLIERELLYVLGTYLFNNSESTCNKSFYSI